MIRLHVKNSTEMEERNAELQNHLFRRKDEIDELKAGVSMNQTEFDNWVIVLKQKEVCKSILIQFINMNIFLTHISLGRH